MMMDRDAYMRYVARLSPKSPVCRNTLFAFLIGGTICTVGQIFMHAFSALGLSQENAGTATSCALVFLSALATGLSWYDDLAKIGGAGTLVPITGFANAVVSPAVEFKTEGFILGVGVKMFTIAGPVIAYGVSASVLYGVIYWLYTLFV